mgnify:FL=1
MIFQHLIQGSDEWLQARAGAITASRFCDARARLKRASGDRKAGDWHGDAIRYAWTVAMERVAKQSLDDTFQTWQMRRGIDLEPAARRVYEGRTGTLVEESGIVFTDDRWFGYSTDGFVEGDGMVEIKCPAACDKIGAIWANPAGAADEYLDQILGGLWITGRQWCDLVVYCPWLESVGKDLFAQRITRDEAAIEALEADLLSFLALVQGNEQVLRA